MSEKKAFILTYVNEEYSSPISEEILADNPYVKNVFSYAVKAALSEITSYWSSENAQLLIKDDSFNYLWNTFPDKRKDLLELAQNKVARTGYAGRVKSLTVEFCLNFLNEFYSKIPVDYAEDTNRHRARLTPLLKPGYDYLSELNKFSLIEDHENLYTMWSRVAMTCSYDEKLFDYLWSKVKREQGATDKKQAIVRAALDNNCLSDNLVKKIAKSSPKRLKRVVVSGVADKMRMLNRRLRKAEADYSSSTPEDIANIKEKLAKLEARAMLFVGCDDYAVVESLMDCLSRDNLPWLMPSASQHYWLSQRLDRLIESEANDS